MQTIDQEGTLGRRMPNDNVCDLKGLLDGSPALAAIGLVTFDTFGHFIIESLGSCDEDKFSGEGFSALLGIAAFARSEEHTSELQSLMRISSAVFCLKKKKIQLY